MTYNPKERLDYLDERCYPSSKWTLDEHDALRAWKIEKVLKKEAIIINSKEFFRKYHHALTNLGVLSC